MSVKQGIARQAISQYFEHATGFNLEEGHLALNARVCYNFSNYAINHPTQCLVYPFFDQTVSKIRVPTLQSASEYVWRVFPGMTTKKSRNLNDAAVQLWISHDDELTLEREFSLLMQEHQFTIATTEETTLAATKLQRRFRKR